MVADNDINPLIPSWPTRPVSEKSGTQNRRHQPEQEEQEQQKKKELDIETEETDADEDRKTDPGHIDEYA